MKNHSSRVTFSKTHRRTQRMYSWTGRDLMNVRKMIPCQTNSRILKYIMFSVQKSHIFYSLSEARFPWRPYYSWAGKGSTSHLPRRCTIKGCWEPALRCSPFLLAIYLDARGKPSTMFPRGVACRDGAYSYVRGTLRWKNYNTQSQALDNRSTEPSVERYHVS